MQHVGLGEEQIRVAVGVSIHEMRVVDLLLPKGKFAAFGECLGGQIPRASKDRKSD